MNMRSTNNPYGSFTEATDKRIGNAYPVIEAVHAKLAELTLLAENLHNLTPGQVELRYVEETRSLEWRYADEEVWHVLVVYEDYSEINSSVLAAADITTADAIATAADRAAIAAMLNGDSPHALNMNNPHNTTKVQVGLGNADNTSDANKPVSSAQATAILAAVSNHVGLADPHEQYVRTADITIAGLALLDDADAAAQRVTLGLGTLATQNGIFSGSSSGTNTGDNAANSLYSSLVSNATHSGDVTGDTALTIAAGAVTYAKMQDVSATDKLLGRSTAGAGDVEEIACTAAGRALLDDVNAAAQRVTLSAAPVSATYIVQTASSELSAEQALGALASGLLKNTTTTGVLSIAAAGTDYIVPGATFNLGTTAMALNRASAALALTGISSIDGSAATWTTARNLAGNSVNGSANVAFSNKFIVQGTTDTGLSGAQFLGALATGLLKNTTTTGVLTAAVAGTDFQSPIGTISGIAKGNGANALIAAAAGTDYLTYTANNVQGADIASAATINLDTATGSVVDVTGVAAISTIILSQGRSRIVRFTGSLTLTNGASLVLPGAANIATATGDYAFFVGYAAGVVRCVSFLKASQLPYGTTNNVSRSMLTNGSALSVIGVAANASSAPSDIGATAASGGVLRESGSTIGFGTIATAGIANSAITYAKIQNVSATDKLLGRVTAGAGVVEEIALTAAGRALIDDADATAQRATLAAAPAAATYIVQTASSELSAEQVLGALTTGLLKNTTTTGVLSIATAGTDYSAGTAALATGLVKSTTATGALTIAVAGTDFQAPIGTISGIAKGNGANALIAAVAGTDYQAPIGTISGMVKGNGANALIAAVSGTDYQAPIGTISGVAKGNGANALTAAVAGTDFLTYTANSVQGADVASAATINLDAATGNVVDVTGVVAITTITLAQGRSRIVRFTGALTLTNGASLILPGAANITTSAGDYAIFVGYAASVVRCVSFLKAGQAPYGTTNNVSRAMLVNGSALSVIGVAANSSGAPSDISAVAASGAVLRESGNTIGFGTIATAGIANSAVTYAKIQNVSATDKLLGRSTAGAGVVEEISLTAAGRALIDDADAAAQRTTLGLGTLATQSGTFSGSSSGTNTGDNAVNSLYSGLVSNATHTGDVTGNTALTIAANAVTYAKMQDVSATDKLLGRSTAGSGDVEEIACTAAGRAILDDIDAAAQRITLSAAPSAATYIVQTASSELSSEQVLGALASGLLKNTTTTGVLDIAIAGTDYTTPSSTETQTNKSFSDSTTYIVDNSDVTKKLQFQVEQVTTATTQTLIVQDVSGSMAVAGLDDVLKSPRVGELGSAAYIDVGQIPRNYFTEIITADKTLTASDAGKVFLVLGTGIDITLPAASTCSSGWMVTIYNDNSSNSPVAHASASANLPFGQNMVTLIRQGSDTLNGQTTQIHGFATIIGPRQSADIWLASATGFAAKGSDRIGWKDLVSEPHTHGAALNDPSETAVTGSFYKALEFTNAGAASQKEVYISFHIGHDYMMGSRLYPHVHWITNNTDTTVCRWGFQYSVAKGHQQQAFFTEGGGSTTVYVNQTKSATAYMHHIAEVSDADAIPATNLEPDSVIIMRIFRDSDNAADTFTGSAWVTNVDCHYLADRHATPNKAPAFFV